MKGFILLFLSFTLSLTVLAQSKDLKTQLKSAIEVLSENSLGEVKCEVPQTLSEDFIQCANGKVIKLFSVTEERVDELFKKIKTDDQIPWAYAEDGCYARAQRICQLLDKEGVSSAKIFAEGNLQANSAYANPGKAKWWYHVAPIVLVMDKDGKKRLKVLDPSVADRPLDIQEWYKKIVVCAGCNVHTTYLTQKYNLYPRNKKDKVDTYQEDEEMSKLNKHYMLIHNKRISQ